MYLNDTSQILVIILSVALTVFLVVAVILVIKFIKIANRINHITTSVDETVQNVHDVVAGVKKVVTPALITNAITGWIEKLSNRKNKESKNE